MDPALCERAAECGLRSFQMMAGALDGLAVKPRLLSHRDTFGVGYAVALFEVTGEDSGRCYADACAAAQRDRIATRRAGEDPWVRLARLSLETYVRQGQTLQTLPENLPAELTEQAAGAFVSLHKEGRLRGVHRHHCPDREKSGAGDPSKCRLSRHPGSALSAGAGR